MASAQINCTPQASLRVGHHDLNACHGIATNRSCTATPSAVGCKTLSVHETIFESPAPTVVTAPSPSFRGHDRCADLTIAASMTSTTLPLVETGLATTAPSGQLWQQMMALSDEDYLEMVLSMNQARANLPDELDSRLGFIDLAWCLEARLDTIQGNEKSSEAHRLFHMLVSMLSYFLESSTQLEYAGEHKGLATRSDLLCIAKPLMSWSILKLST
jgi:hypothetical protein